MKLQLKPGDYVSTKGMTEEQYHAVCRRFIECGCKTGEYPDFSEAKRLNFIGWAKRTDGIFHSEECGTGSWPLFLNEILISDLSKEKWNGEGLPPVGTECEVIRRGVVETDRAKISYQGNGVLCYIDMDTGMEFSAAHDAHEFRPIKSEREKAIEEMRDSFNVEIGNQDFIFGALYDAGYRKQESEK